MTAPYNVETGYFVVYIKNNCPSLEGQCQLKTQYRDKSRIGLSVPER